MLHLGEILSVTLVLFSVIDIIGSIPLVIELKRKDGYIKAFNATLVSGTIMVVFLFLGESILRMFSLDVASFSIAGAIVLFLIAMEMILGIRLFKEQIETGSSHIVPIAFPLIAGAGTMTTIISLRAEYEQINILFGILLNLIPVYLVLKFSGWIEQKIGITGADILRKVFGVILLALAVKLIKNNLVF